MTVLLVLGLVISMAVRSVGLSCVGSMAEEGEEWGCPDSFVMLKLIADEVVQFLGILFPNQVG